MLGGGPYQVSTCPKCGCLMWNGVCENRECEYHWYPLDEDGNWLKHDCEECNGCN